MADQKINALPPKAAPATGDKLLLVGAAEESLIDYDALADAILNKLTSKTYTLDQGTKSFVAALNELNSKTYLLQGGTPIPENADMNTYTTPGNYYVISNAQAATLSNSPFGNNAFILKVEYANGVTYPRQIFTEYSTGRKAIRFISSSGGSWSDWLYFSDDATLFHGTSIQSGDDLDDYTTPGIYYCSNSSISGTLLHLPEAIPTGFALLVLPKSGATCVQIIFCSGIIYSRLHNDGGFVNWYKFAGTVISS